MLSMTARRPRLPSTTRYEFREPIGAGGTGTVYRAFDKHTEQLVAIKVLDAKLSENLTLHRRLAVEFQAASALDHPNIVRALHVDNDGDISYLVYELVEGKSLGSRIDEHGPLPEDIALRITTQIAQALDYAHQRQVVHRDVKPDNILLLPDGKAKLTDFGLAKNYAAENQDLTRQASGLGTPHFMAPEQFANAKTADARCDVYSLAATLYNALTGKLPFDAASTIAILANKEANRLVTPRSLVPGLSGQVDAAIRQALDPVPGKRPATCLEFFKQLTGRRRVAGRASTAAPAQTPAPKGGAERRSAARFPLKVGSCAIVDVNAHGAGEEERWPLVVRDVGVAGIGLLLARRFEPGTDLADELAAGPDGKAERLPVRVVRVQEDRAGHWVHGCVFPNPLPDDQIQALLKFA